MRLAVEAETPRRRSARRTKFAPPLLLTFCLFLIRGSSDAASLTRHRTATDQFSPNRHSAIKTFDDDLSSWNTTGSAKLKRSPDSLRAFYEFLVSKGLNRFCKLLRKANIDDTLLSVGPFTLFAPTDEAFAFLPGNVLEEIRTDVTKLRQFLLYHIVPGSISSVDFQNEKVLNSADGSPIRFNVYANGQVATASGAQITEADIRHSSYIVHIVDHVLYPPPTMDIVNQIKQKHDTFYRLLVSADLVDYLTGGTFTVFAPRDEAFRALPKSIRDFLNTNTTVLQKVLLNHVVPGTYFSPGLPVGSFLTSLNNVPLYISTARGLLLVNRIPIVQSDIPVSNGVIHLLNRVLLPPEVIEDCNCLKPKSTTPFSDKATSPEPLPEKEKVRPTEQPHQNQPTPDKPKDVESGKHPQSTTPSPEASTERPQPPIQPEQNPYQPNNPSERPQENPPVQKPPSSPYPNVPTNDQPQYPPPNQSEEKPYQNEDNYPYSSPPIPGQEKRPPPPRQPFEPSNPGQSLPSPGKPLSTDTPDQNVPRENEPQQPYYPNEQPGFPPSNPGYPNQQFPANPYEQLYPYNTPPQSPSANQPPSGPPTPDCDPNESNLCNPQNPSYSNQPSQGPSPNQYPETYPNRDQQFPYPDQPNPIPSSPPYPYPEQPDQNIPTGQPNKCVPSESNPCNPIPRPQPYPPGQNAPPGGQPTNENQPCIPSESNPCSPIPRPQPYPPGQNAPPGGQPINENQPCIPSESNPCSPIPRPQPYPPGQNAPPGGQPTNENQPCIPSEANPCSPIPRPQPYPPGQNAPPGGQPNNENQPCIPSEANPCSSQQPYPPSNNIPSSNQNPLQETHVRPDQPSPAYPDSRYPQPQKPTRPGQETAKETPEIPGYPDSTYPQPEKPTKPDQQTPKKTPQIPEYPDSGYPQPEEPFSSQTPSRNPYNTRPRPEEPFPSQTPSRNPYNTRPRPEEPFPSQTPSRNPYNTRPRPEEPFPSQTPSRNPYNTRPQSEQPSGQDEQLPSYTPSYPEIPHYPQNGSPPPQQSPRHSQPQPSQTPPKFPDNEFATSPTEYPEIPDSSRNPHQQPTTGRPSYPYGSSPQSHQPPKKPVPFDITPRIPEEEEYNPSGGTPGSTPDDRDIPQSYTPGSKEPKRPDSERPIPEVPELSYGEPGGDVPDNVVDLLEKPNLTIDKKPVTFNIILHMMHDIGLPDMLNTRGPFTMCIPTDQAFSGLPSALLNQLMNNKNMLRKIILFHVVATKVPTNELQDNQILRTFQGPPMFVNVRDGGKTVLVGGSRVVGTTTTKDSVVYILDRVLSSLPDDNVLTALRRRPHLSQFAGFINNSPLRNFLRRRGPFTLFAPTNEAISSLPVEVINTLTTNGTALNEVLFNHVVHGAQYTNAVPQEITLTTPQGGTLRFYVTPEGPQVNGAQILYPDISTGNGIVHVIDRVILSAPPLVTFEREGSNGKPPSPEKKIDFPTLYNVAHDMRVSTFLGWLEQANLLSELKPEVNYTIFAPTDEAISALPPTLLKTINNDVNQLMPIVKYHVVPENIPIKEIHNEMTAPTLLPGKDVRFNFYQNSSQMTVAGSPIKEEKKVGNILLTVVSRVLYPPSGDVFTTIAKSPILQDLKQAVSRAGLEDFLKGPGPFTVFAPTESAFRNLPKAEYLRIFNSPDHLRDLLLHHIVNGTVFLSGVESNVILTPLRGGTLNVTITPHQTAVNGLNILYPDITATNGVVHVLDELLL